MIEGIGRKIALVGLAAAGLAVFAYLARPLAASPNTALAGLGLAVLALLGIAVLIHRSRRQGAELRAARAELASRIRELEAALDSSHTQARLANWSKSEFLSGMGHELRTPLNAIIGFSEIVRDERFGPMGNAQYRDYLRDINESGQHLLAVIDDLMDIARIETGKIELKETAVDIPRLLRARLSEIEDRAKAGVVSLDLRLPNGLPGALPELLADKAKLGRILANLLSNAVKFTPPGGKVTVVAWSRPDAGYVFQVADSGAGIALKDIPLALAPFGQVANEMRRQFDGTGLGLPLTKALVELHAGCFDLQSEPGKGTTVTIRFPAERVIAARKAA